MKKSLVFLEKLMNLPSPSGYEDQVRTVWYKELKKNADKISVDIHGNAIAVVNEKQKLKVMLTGHMDELGFQVSYVDDKGFIYFGSLGGFDIGIVAGRKVRIHTAKGMVLGVIGKKAIHLMEKAQRDKVSKQHELYIDIGAKNKKEVLKIIELGDPVTYDANFEKLRNDNMVSRAFDNKIGAYIIAEVMKEIYKKKEKCKAALYSVATVQEEVGIRGARTASYAINPQIGIALDVTHATDTPDTDAKKDGDVKLGAGVVIARGPNINEKVFRMLKQIADKKKIKYQIEPISTMTGTDANMIQVTKAGIATGLVSIPCRYMHTNTEVVSEKDVDAAVRLLVEFCFAINAKMDFTPAF